MAYNKKCLIGIAAIIILVDIGILVLISIKMIPPVCSILLIPLPIFIIIICIFLIWRKWPLLRENNAEPNNEYNDYYNVHYIHDTNDDVDFNNVDDDN